MIVEIESTVKKKPRYHQIGLEEMTEPLTNNRSIEGLGGYQALVKWKSSVLLYSITRPALRRILDIML